MSSRKGMVAGFMLAVVLALVAGGAKAEATIPRIDINTATAEELTALPRIGPALAARIVSYREEHGPFQKVEELMNVRGIGAKVFENLRERVSAEPQAQAKKSPARSGS